MPETKQTIAELKEKIKAVEDFEKRNANFKERNDIIEQLSKNRSIPARLLDELSSLQPTGIWLQTLSVAGDSISLDGYGFTNTEIVTYRRQYKRLQTIYRGLPAGIKKYGP